MKFICIHWMLTTFSEALCGTIMVSSVSTNLLNNSLDYSPAMKQKHKYKQTQKQKQNTLNNTGLCNMCKISHFLQ